MIDIGVLAAILMVCVITLGVGESVIAASLHRRKLISSGRFITPHQAIHEANRGNGFVCLNRSNLPAKWWFVHNCDVRTEHDIYDIVRSRSLLIHPVTQADEALLESLQENILFVDPSLQD